MKNLEMTYNETWVVRDNKLKELNISYENFLKSPYWSRLRLMTRSKENYSKCELCNSDKVELHHSTYKWIGTSRELSPIKALCHHHHNMIHEFAKETGISIRISTNLFTAYSDKEAIKQGKLVYKEIHKVYNEYCKKYNCSLEQRRSYKLVVGLQQRFY